MSGSKVSRSVRAHETWIDYARAVCAVAVVFLHAWGTVVVSHTAQEIGLVRLAVWECLDLALGSFAVPVFFMLTGYLLLDRDKEVGLDRIRRYALRMLGVLVAFGYPYCLIEHVVGGEGPSLALLGACVVDLLCGETWDHMWYVYAILGFYLTLPLFKRFAQAATRAEWELVQVVLGVFVLGFSTVRDIFSVDLVALTPFLGTSAFYILLGGYVRTFWRDDEHTPAWVVPTGLAALALGLVLACVAIAVTGDRILIIRNPECPLVVMWALAVFVMLRRAGHGATGAAPQAAVRSLATCSFGIYLVNPVFYHVMYRLLGLSPLGLPYGASVLLVATDLAASWVLAWVLRRVPGYRRLL